jgi:hypothetical protein
MSPGCRAASQYPLFKSIVESCWLGNVSTLLGGMTAEDQGLSDSLITHVHVFHVFEHLIHFSLLGKQESMTWLMHQMGVLH